jgi:hypothetical protein
MIYQRRKPKNIIPELQLEVKAAVDLLYPKYDGDIYICRLNRGRTFVSKKIIYIPLSAYNRGVDYFLYYVAHELAHYVSLSCYHDEQFYNQFKKICPLFCQYFELNYKPRNAMAYGIKT